MKVARAPARVAGRVVLGALEHVSIPAWGVESLPARVDTGARTSALHVVELAELPGGKVRFVLKPGQKKLAPIETPISRRGRVRSTSGKLETRLFVTARVRLGGAEHRIELGLVDRSAMLYRMLLGRSALSGRFVVDVSRRFMLGR
jgi:ribosomal protein S6--L-glutamate ligase